VAHVQVPRRLIVQGKGAARRHDTLGPRDRGLGLGGLSEYVFRSYFLGKEKMRKFYSTAGSRYARPRDPRVARPVTSRRPARTHASVSSYLGHEPDEYKAQPHSTHNRNVSTRLLWSVGGVELLRAIRWFKSM